MKFWIDDVRFMPEGYDVWCKSVNEAIDRLESLPEGCEVLLDMDHDAGDYAGDGGDYIRILDYIEATQLALTHPCSFHIHSMNPVGRQNMMRVIQSRGWRYVY